MGCSGRDCLDEDVECRRYIVEVLGGQDAIASVQLGPIAHPSAAAEVAVADHQASQLPWITLLRLKLCGWRHVYYTTENTMLLALFAILLPIICLVRTCDPSGDAQLKPGAKVSVVQEHSSAGLEASRSRHGDSVMQYDELAAARGCLGRFPGSELMPFLKSVMGNSA